MVHELLEARDEKRLLRIQKRLGKYSPLIIDELGFVPLSKTGVELLPSSNDNIERRQSLLDTIRPALPLIGRIARLVSKAVMSVLAAERQQIARDAAFLAGLHADWEAGQCAKLEELSRAAGPAPSDDGPGS